MKLDDLRAARLVASDPSAPMARTETFHISCSTVWSSKAKDETIISQSGEREKSLPCGATCTTY
jgi:hypothetical protein